MYIFCSIALVATVLLTSTKALTCHECLNEGSGCTPDEVLLKGCKGGLTDDVCHCCKTCAKVFGESCGGSWDVLGRCDAGLVCDNDNSEVPFYEGDGKCVKKVATTTQEQNEKTTEPNESSSDWMPSENEKTTEPTESSSDWKNEKTTEPNESSSDWKPKESSSDWMSFKNEIPESESTTRAPPKGKDTDNASGITPDEMFLTNEV